jgi:hypothetical protein
MIGENEYSLLVLNKRIELKILSFRVLSEI